MYYVVSNERAVVDCERRGEGNRGQYGVQDNFIGTTE
jgi:hypothetical protein